MTFPQLTKEENDKLIEETKCETRLAMEKAGHSMDRIAKRLAIMAYSDIEDYYEITEGGERILKPLRTPKGKKKKITQAIKRIKEKTYITESKDGQSYIKNSETDVEVYDAMDALKFAASLMGMVKPQKLEVTGKNGGPVKVTGLTDDELYAIAARGRIGADTEKKSKKKPARLRKGN